MMVRTRLFEIMHQPQLADTLIRDRYRIIHLLGQGGNGVTYRAEDSQTGQPVALKELSLKGLSNWKKLELFEREAQTLKALNHPVIPQYLDYFQTDTADNRFFYLVQEIVEGHSLAERLAAGDRFSEEQVKRIAMMVLQALTYLHGLTPPVIHRDIKPQNLILGTDGRIYVVDFGAVQLVHRATTAMGSTVVGTFGYMAPEQLQCRAVPATDLYSLGATLLHLLTRQNPSNLPQRRLKIDFRAATAVSDSFADWLDGLIEPVIEDRFVSAEAAFMALQDPHFSRHSIPNDLRSLQPLAVPKLPLKTKVKLIRSSQSLLIRVPLSLKQLALTVSIILFSTLFLLTTYFTFFNFPGFGFVYDLSRGGLFGFNTDNILRFINGFFFQLSGYLPLFAGLFGFFIVYISKLSPSNVFGGRVTVEIKDDIFRLTRRILGFKVIRIEPIENLHDVTWDGQFIGDTKIQVKGNHTYTFGAFLSEGERHWLAMEIKSFIQEQRDRS